MKLEFIESTATVVPSTGKNKGITMHVINGKFWSKVEPKPHETHVCLEDVEGTGEHKGKTFSNVTGYSTDTRMDINSKIALLTKNDPALSMAIATLLR